MKFESKHGTGRYDAICCGTTSFSQRGERVQKTRSFLYLDLKFPSSCIWYDTYIFKYCKERETLCQSFPQGAALCPLAGRGQTLVGGEHAEFILSWHHVDTFMVSQENSMMESIQSSIGATTFAKVGHFLVLSPVSGGHLVLRVSRMCDCEEHSRHQL